MFDWWLFGAVLGCAGGGVCGAVGQLAAHAGCERVCIDVQLFQAMPLV